MITECGGLDLNGKPGKWIEDNWYINPGLFEDSAVVFLFIIRQVWLNNRLNDDCKIETDYKKRGAAILKIGGTNS